MQAFGRNLNLYLLKLEVKLCQSDISGKMACLLTFIIPLITLELLRKLDAKVGYIHSNVILIINIWISCVQL